MKKIKYVHWIIMIIVLAVQDMTFCQANAANGISTDFVKQINTNIIVQYYVDAVSGNDKYDGRSSRSPWKTIDKINGVKMQPGSAVNFKREQVFRGVITAQSGVTYRSYGSGDKPMILGSHEVNASSAWIQEANNIWTYQNAILGLDVGNIIFNQGEATGIRVFQEGDLDKDLEFFYNKQNTKIKIFSQTNPAQRFRDVELALAKGIFILFNVQDVIVQDLALFNTAANAVSINGCNRILIENLDVAYIGGANLYSLINQPGVIRYGNGIEIYKNGQDILIRNNKINQVYDSALTNQSFLDEATQNNIIYQENIVTNSEWCFELWIYAGNSYMKNVLFEKNICSASGLGWGHNQRPDGPNGNNIVVLKNPATTENVFIQNNVFYKATEANMRFSDPNDQRFFTIVNNVVF